jgi:hypothetical protein
MSTSQWGESNMRRVPSPSLAISILALIVALSGAGYSATGGNFILGKSNNASSQTRLVTTLNGAAFRVDNASTAASATGVTIATNAARPPLVVTSSAKVARLNADKLDGLDSTQFPNKLVISFNLAPGAITDQIVPPLSQPVFIMGIATGDVDVDGLGHVTLLRQSNSAGLTWVGLDSGGIITSGHSKTTGNHIVYIEGGHQVDIEVNGPNTIRVHNEDAVARSGVVTLIW